MKAIKISIMLIGLGVVFTACEEEIELKLKNDEPRLVVDGYITTDTMAHVVRLTSSGSYFENQPMPGISGATVTLSDGYESLVLQESETNPGDYLTPEDYYGKQSHHYSLKITNAIINGKGGDIEYSAESFLPPLVQMDSISMDFFSLWDLWRIFLHGQDPAGVKNYYWFRLKINDWWYSNDYKSTTFTDDTFFDGNYADGVWLFGIDAIEDYDFFPGDELMVEVWMVDEPFFEYIRGAYIETNYRTPIFSGPPANVPGNISNGALGVFAAGSINRLTLTNTISRDE